MIKLKLKEKINSKTSTTTTPLIKFISNPAYMLV